MMSKQINLQTAAYAARVTIHSSMKISPGALVFQRDMLLDIPLIADLHLLQQKRQVLINERLFQANRAVSLTIINHKRKYLC